MPLLVCSAMSCIYNKGEYCSKGDITVGGKEAEQPGETCCESFMGIQKKTDCPIISFIGTHLIILPKIICYISVL